jgi:hypothetical protein
MIALVRETRCIGQPVGETGRDHSRRLHRGHHDAAQCAGSTPAAPAACSLPRRRSPLAPSRLPGGRNRSAGRRRVLLSPPNARRRPLVTLGWITASILGFLDVTGPIALRVVGPATWFDYGAFALVLVGTYALGADPVAERRADRGWRRRAVRRPRPDMAWPGRRPLRRRVTGPEDLEDEIASACGGLAHLRASGHTRVGQASDARIRTLRGRVRDLRHVHGRTRELRGGPAPARPLENDVLLPHAVAMETGASPE